MPHAVNESHFVVCQDQLAVIDRIVHTTTEARNRVVRETKRQERQDVDKKEKETKGVNKAAQNRKERKRNRSMNITLCPVTSL